MKANHNFVILNTLNLNMKKVHINHLDQLSLNHHQKVETIIKVYKVHLHLTLILQLFTKSLLKEKKLIALKLKKLTLQKFQSMTFKVDLEIIMEITMAIKTMDTIMVTIMDLIMKEKIMEMLMETGMMVIIMVI